MSEELRRLGAAIRSTREQRGLSVADLATGADVDVARLRALEQGEVDPAYDLLVRLADGLGTRPATFAVLAEGGEAPTEQSTGKPKPHAALGAALRVARKERRYSQEGFAPLAGIDRSYYGAIERGEVNVSLSTLEKLAAGLGMKLSALLARAGL